MTTCETVVVEAIRRALGCTGVGVARNRWTSSDWFGAGTRVVTKGGGHGLEVGFYVHYKFKIGKRSCYLYAELEELFFYCFTFVPLSTSCATRKQQIKKRTRTNC